MVMIRFVFRKRIKRKSEIKNPLKHPFQGVLM
ncbi:Putative protein [Zobellia galactanivorans]|uniref:Uncharacterized protein n=1 Tax=Zobellia galactanivorans (strain DSM 12802 / CCUG 47099 / CIP 106680 / NCIMB 13871 / Dsij) TaxID=63186 RepID=G0L6H8_ZOBGA|nr:Putative protein [Zobellia galactanivorans]